MNRVAPFLLALQFLSRVPVPWQRIPHNDELIGRSLLYYPVVGLVLGLLLWCVARWLDGSPVAIQAALVLVVWVSFSGGLHLDGLADTVDAWAGGQGDRERTLALMKDPRSGPFAIVVLILLLLCKYAALMAVLESGLYWLLLLPPWLGRSALPLLFLTTPYVRPGGLGQVLADHLPRRSIGFLMALTGLALIGLGWKGSELLLLCSLFFILWRGFLMARLGGFTGDTAGALLELTEVLVIVFFAL